MGNTIKALILERDYILANRDRIKNVALEAYREMYGLTLGMHADVEINIEDDQIYATGAMQQTSQTRPSFEGETFIIIKVEAWEIEVANQDDLGTEIDYYLNYDAPAEIDIQIDYYLDNLNVRIDESLVGVVQIGNNIQAILDAKNISINRMAQDLDFRYATAHNIATRDSLDTTKLESLVRIASYLQVDIKELYTNKEEVEMTIVERVVMISEYIEKVYADEIDYMQHYSKGNVTVYENANDYIENLESGTGEKYNFDGTAKHFNEIMKKHYTGGANLIHNTQSILIAIDSIDGPTISFYEVTADDFWELWEQMTKDATKRHPGEDEDDEPHYPSIWIDAAIKNSIGSMARLNTNKELNGYEKEI